MSYKQHTNCRICKSEKLTKYIDLGSLPLSNNLCETADEVSDTYPLQVMLCENCGLSQLSIVVDPELLFGHYVYRSSISKGYKDHCRKMAKDLKIKYNLSENSFMLDLAGNDGCLLNEFIQEIGLKCLNIDPAKNLLEINEAQGIRMFTTFWSIDAALHLQNTRWPKADLITATNVFAHVDNVHDFLNAAKIVLNDNGVIILEFPYLLDFIENNEFDTIYAEHNSYFSITPLRILCNEIGLTVMEVEKQEIHGGTVRVHIGFGKEQKSVLEFIAKEPQSNPKHSTDLYSSFGYNVQRTIDNFSSNIKSLKSVGFKIAAFAASAKGNTLLNCAKITNEQIDYIVDQTPEKLNKFSPGTHIKIVDISELLNNTPDYLLILSWNFKNEIIEKCIKLGYKGRFIIPIPEFNVINQL